MKRTAKTPEPSPLAPVEALIKLALKYKVKIISVGSTMVEMDPAAFAAPPTDPKQLVKALTADPKTTVCQCGHSYDEHNEAGCLQGCALGRCAPEE